MFVVCNVTCLSHFHTICCCKTNIEDSTLIFYLIIIFSWVQVQLCFEINLFIVHDDSKDFDRNQQLFIKILPRSLGLLLCSQFQLIAVDLQPRKMSIKLNVENPIDKKIRSSTKVNLWQRKMNSLFRTKEFIDNPRKLTVEEGPYQHFYLQDQQHLFAGPLVLR